MTESRTSGAPSSHRLSTPESRNHPDFQQEWIQQLLSAPSVQVNSELWKGWDLSKVNNTMFNHTLAHESGFKARILLERPCEEPDAASETEFCYIIAVGTGLDGAAGRAHGGLTSMLMDHVLGTSAGRHNGIPDAPPATATMTVDYKNPVQTPCIVLARAWLLKESVGRKSWVKGVLEDGRGKVYATAKALFVNPRAVEKAVL